MQITNATPQGKYYPDLFDHQSFGSDSGSIQTSPRNHAASEIEGLRRINKEEIIMQNQKRFKLGTGRNLT